MKLELINPYWIEKDNKKEAETVQKEQVKDDTVDTSNKVQVTE